MQKSVILKTLVCDGEVSLAVLDTRAAVAEGISRHGFSPVASAAFGRALTASAYLCSWLKEEESTLSVTISGDGVGGKICISGDGALDMRGFTQEPHADLPPRADGKLDVGAYVGKNGTFTVVRDDGSRLPFVGTCGLVSGEIAEDLSAYFLISEQRPTAVALGVLMGKEGCLAAGGIFFQPLPGASEASVAFCEEEIGKYTGISSILQAEGAEGLMHRYSKEYDCREIRYRCHCSREKAKELIRTLGRAEAESILDELGMISVHCHYCNTDHKFSREEISSLFEE